MTSRSVAERFLRARRYRRSSAPHPLGSPMTMEHRSSIKFGSATDPAHCSSITIETATGVEKCSSAPVGERNGNGGALLRVRREANGSGAPVLRDYLERDGYGALLLRYFELANFGQAAMRRIDGPRRIAPVTGESLSLCLHRHAALRGLDRVWRANLHQRYGTGFHPLSGNDGAPHSRVVRIRKRSAGAIPRMGRQRAFGQVAVMGYC